MNCEKCGSPLVLRPGSDPPTWCCGSLACPRVGYTAYVEKPSEPNPEKDTEIDGE